MWLNAAQGIAVQKAASWETVSSIWQPCALAPQRATQIEPSGGFDRTFLGRTPTSGYRFKIPLKLHFLGKFAETKCASITLTLSFWVGRTNAIQAALRVTSMFAFQKVLWGTFHGCPPLGPQLMFIFRKRKNPKHKHSGGIGSGLAGCEGQRILYVRVCFWIMSYVSDKKHC